MRASWARTARTAQGKSTAEQLGCTGDAAIACLRGLSVDALWPVQQKFIQPAYGTAFLPTHPGQAIRRGDFHRAPVLSGNTRDETTQGVSRYDDRSTAMTEQTFAAVMSETAPRSARSTPESTTTPAH
nr:carboxylesterase family protein [Actinokineospora globicatena]